MSTTKEFDEFINAICEGEIDQVQKFLDEGMEPNGKENLRDYEYPLSQALFHKQFDIADKLIEAGARPRSGAAFLEDYLGQEEYEPYIEKILDDACSEISENIQKSFLKALQLGDKSLAARLLGFCPPPGEFTTRSTPLGEAIRTEHEDLACWLIDVGFDPSGRNEHEKPPVILAVIADLPRLLGKLFELGVSPQLRVWGHQNVLLPGPPLYKKLRYIREFPKNDKYEIFHEGSLLHVAAVTGSAKCAKVLLAAGLDPNEADSEGRTPALLAAMGGEATRGVLQLLPEPDLSSGSALVDLLTRAILNGDVDGVQRAIDKGVDLSVRIKPAVMLEDTPFLGEATPLIFAAGRGDVEILKRLAAAGADLEQDDWPEGKKRSSSGGKFIFENSGLDALLTMPIVSGRTPLGWAALAGEADAMRVLLVAGADTQASDIFGFTMLHLAAMSDEPAALEVALGVDIDLHAEAMDGMTPLHAAAAVNTGNSIDMLVNAGADPTRYDNNGATPYVTAKEWGKPRAYRKLEPHTPKEFQKKKRKPKPQPDWQWSRDEFDTLLKTVKKSHGKEARKLTTQKFRDQLAKAAGENGFREVAEQVRKRLKGGELGSWEDSPHLVWFEATKPTDARLLKLQQEFLPRGVYVVRQLLSSEESGRVFVVPTDHLFELLGAFGINGVNMGLDSDLTIAWLMNLHRRHPFQVIGLMHDGMEFRFDNPIKQPNELAQELMIACPPEMDENTEVIRLRKKLKSIQPQVLLWWD